MVCTWGTQSLTRGSKIIRGELVQRHGWFNKSLQWDSDQMWVLLHINENFISRGTSYESLRPLKYKYVCI